MKPKRMNWSKENSKDLAKVISTRASESTKTYECKTGTLLVNSK